MRYTDARVRRPQRQRRGGVMAELELAGQPGRIGAGPLVDDPPGRPAGKAVDGILAGRVVRRQLVGALIPGEGAAADAVGKWEQDRDAAARRPAILEELRVG